MEYIYAALVVHNAGNEVTEDSVTDVLEAAGVDVDESRVSALVAALDGVNIDEAVEQAAAAPAAGAGGGAAAAGGEDEEEEEAEAEEEEEEEEAEEEAEEDAGEGLGELFG
ncbi:MAG: 50S ribosomal protein P1 [Halobacteria archaeon]|nr:50S ribosomal protein P1 [Halobacteria archaeon]